MRVFCRYYSMLATLEGVMRRPLRGGSICAWHNQGSMLARQLLQELKIPSKHIFEADIAPMVDAFLQSINLQYRQGGERIADPFSNILMHFPRTGSTGTILVTVHSE